MTIEEQLNEELKTAMRAKQADTVACIRQLKSKVQEAVNAKGFSGPTDDSLFQKVIVSYTKSLEKGITELSAAGERSKPLCDKYAAEIKYLSKYLPQTLSEADTRQIVLAAVAALPTKDPKLSGKVMGGVLKDHKGKVDPALVRKLVEEALAG